MNNIRNICSLIKNNLNLVVLFYELKTSIYFVPDFVVSSLPQGYSRFYTVKTTLGYSVSYIFKSQGCTVSYTVLHSENYSVRLCVLYFYVTGLHGVLHSVTQ